MKTQTKLLALLLIIASTLTLICSMSAQCFSPTYGPPLRTEIQTPNPYFDFTNGTCAGPGALTLSGVGINMIHPLAMFDVNLGDIDVSSADKGYMIAEQYALWLTKPVNQNTWVGYSGNSTGAGIQDCYLGYGSGNASSAYATQCSFYGVNSGYSNQGANNTFIGFQSGQGNNNGDANTFVGNNTGLVNYNGGGNSFFGFNAGLANTSSNNTFIGTSAGLTNTTGSSNTALGSGADMASNNLTYASAIGYGATVTTSYNMILGDNINVGIGMSNIAGGSTNKLEIS